MSHPAVLFIAQLHCIAQQILKKGRSMIRNSFSVMTLILCLLALPQKTLSEQTNEDVVHLKNGSIIQGAIVRLSPNDSVTIQTVGGSQLNLSMNKVSKVTMSVMQSDKDVVYLKDGSIIHGAIVRLIPDESLMIQIEGGSQYNFSMDEVLGVEMENPEQIPINPIPPSPKPIVPSRKSPSVAAGLSFVMPGLGQFYNRQSNKGFTFAFIYIGSIVLMITDGEIDNHTAAFGRRGAIAMFGCFANWIVGTCDAYHSATKINARLEWESQFSLSPIATRNRIGALVSRQF